MPVAPELLHQFKIDARIDWDFDEPQLPGGDGLDQVGMQFRHQLGGELAPVVARAVRALDEQRAHAGGMGTRGDRDIAFREA